MKNSNISKWLALTLTVSGMAAWSTNTRAGIFVDGTSVNASGDETYAERYEIAIGSRYYRQSLDTGVLTVTAPGLTGNGGAVAVSSFGSLVTEGNVSFANNIVTGSGNGGGGNSRGGAGYFADNSFITHVNGGTLAFTGNSGSFGGALYSYHNLSLNGTADAILISSNTASVGGAIYTFNGKTEINALVNGALNINNNFARNSGAAIYTGSIGLTGSYGAIMISSNTALGANYGGQGGAFFSYYTVLSATVANNLDISNNTLNAGSGGAFYGSYYVILNNHVGGNLNITGNRSSVGGAFASYDSNSGFIELNNYVGGTLNISGNSAYSGGAFYTNDNKITLTGSYGAILISSNTAKYTSTDYGYGGAICTSFYGNIILATSVGGNLDITGNTASNSGGAFYTYNNAIELNNQVGGTLTISNNTAIGDGGAICAIGASSYNSDIILTGSYGAILISSNTASRGGAFYTGRGIISLTATVAGNLGITDNKGTAFYARNNIELNNYVGGTLTVSGNAGGAFNASGAVILSGSYGAIMISSNSGGAFYAGSDIILSGSAARVGIDNNTAGRRGGAFYAGNNVIISVAEGGLLTASGNKAGADNAGGFAFANSGSMVFNINASGTAIIGDNRAAANETDSISAGKGIYKQGDGTLVLNSVAYSTAYVQGGTLLVANSGEVRANVSVSGGLFRYDSDAAFTRNVTVSGGKFSYNSTKNFAGTLTFTSGTLGGTNLRGLGELNFADSQHILAPGNSIGTLAMDGAKFTNGGVFELEIGGAALNDKLIVNTLTLSDGGFTINLVNLGFDNFNAATDYSWEFVNYSTLNGSFDSEAFTLNTGGFAGMDASRLTISDAGGKLILSYSAVPEPSTWALLLTALAMLLLKVTAASRRRRVWHR